MATLPSIRNCPHQQEQCRLYSYLMRVNIQLTSGRHFSPVKMARFLKMNYTHTQVPFDSLRVGVDFSTVIFNARTAIVFLE